MRRLWCLVLVLPLACSREEGKIVMTPSGVRYQDLVEGDGETARKGTLLEVNFVGTLTDGTEFDKNQDKAKPNSFTLGAGRTIPGWEEGIPGMKVGGKRKLWIPAALGYGSAGFPPKIPANSALIYEVEMLSVKPAPPAGPEPPSVTTPSGLKYQDLVEGSGDVARPGDTVDVHYTGTLTNGSKFDSSLDRGEPFKFKLGAHQVIAGWDEGVAGMKVGGKRKLIIPSELGYGPTGSGKIPGNATLIFDIELLRVGRK